MSKPKDREYPETLRGLPVPVTKPRRGYTPPEKISPNLPKTIGPANGKVSFRMGSAPEFGARRLTPGEWAYLRAWTRDNPEKRLKRGDQRPVKGHDGRPTFFWRYHHLAPGGEHWVNAKQFRSLSAKNRLGVRIHYRRQRAMKGKIVRAKLFKSAREMADAMETRFRAELNAEIAAAGAGRESKRVAKVRAKASMEVFGDPDVLSPVPAVPKPASPRVARGPGKEKRPPPAKEKKQELARSLGVDVVMSD